ncbi:MAG: DUF2752 domain-containing protein [Bacteroidia bacterium]
MITMTEGIQAWMLPCPVKAWAGVDCPGCGFQRSLWALVQGDLVESWSHYPPLIPFLLTMVLVVVWVRSKWQHRQVALVAAVAVTCVFIIGNYAVKMRGGHPASEGRQATHLHELSDNPAVSLASIAEKK